MGDGGAEPAHKKGRCLAQGPPPQKKMERRELNKVGKLFGHASTIPPEAAARPAAALVRPVTAAAHSALAVEMEPQFATAPTIVAIMLVVPWTAEAMSISHFNCDSAALPQRLLAAQVNMAAFDKSFTAVAPSTAH